MTEQPGTAVAPVTPQEAPRPTYADAARKSFGDKFHGATPAEREGEKAFGRLVEVAAERTRKLAAPPAPVENNDTFTVAEVEARDIIAKAKTEAQGVYMRLLALQREAETKAGDRAALAAVQADMRQAAEWLNGRAAQIQQAEIDLAAAIGNRRRKAEDARLVTLAPGLASASERTALAEWLIAERGVSREEALGCQCARTLALAYEAFQADRAGKRAPAPRPRAEPRRRAMQKPKASSALAQLERTGRMDDAVAVLAERRRRA